MPVYRPGFVIGFLFHGIGVTAHSPCRQRMPAYASNKAEGEAENDGQGNYHPHHPKALTIAMPATMSAATRPNATRSRATKPAKRGAPIGDCGSGGGMRGRVMTAPPAGSRTDSG